MKKKRKPKSRNPIAKAVRKLRPKVVPSKRKKIPQKWKSDEDL